jgi:hypothetical protein
VQRTGFLLAELTRVLNPFRISVQFAEDTCDTTIFEFSKLESAGPRTLPLSRSSPRAVEDATATTSSHSFLLIVREVSNGHRGRLRCQ